MISGSISDSIDNEIKLQKKTIFTTATFAVSITVNLFHAKAFENDTSSYEIIRQ